VPDESILSDDLLRQLISVGEVDILVGLHTHNHAATVGQVIQVVREGLLKYFPRERVAILNADGGSHDGSRDIVCAASIDDVRHSANIRALRTLHTITTQYADTVSPGTAMHILVEAADLLRAKACVVVAPESSEIVPEWIDRLLRPIYRDQMDFVAPIYRRHRFEGILVTNLMYPMLRALYGKPVREPHPGEFAFSDRLGGRLVDHPMWTNDAGRMGPEVCFTVEVVADGFRLAQTYLGPKGHIEQQPTDLVTAMRQSVGPLFGSMEDWNGTWASIHGTQPVDTIGPAFDVTAAEADVDLERLRQMFSSGVADLAPVLKSILSPNILEQLQRAATIDEKQFSFPDELWVKTVYEFAAAYHKSVISRDHIIQALAPLYRGRAYQFLTENSQASSAVFEEHIEALCGTFERCKPYLIELWTAQERGL